MGALRGYLHSLDGQLSARPLMMLVFRRTEFAVYMENILYSDSVVGRVSFASKVVLRRAYAFA